MMYKPIYVVGYYHGGRTFVYNTVRQNKKIFTLSNAKKNINKPRGGWAEGQNVLYDHLPIILRNPGGKGGGTGWKHGWNENIDKHHFTEKDVTAEDKKQYLKILEEKRIEVGATEDMRFLDKSQIYVIKTRYLQELFAPSETYFLYVIKNPFVLCYKPLKHRVGGGGDAAIIKSCEHVINTYNYFMKDSKYLKHSKIIRLEDVILKTRETIEGICNFLELDFDEDMIPHPPKFKKFYPIKTDVVDDDGVKEIANDQLDKVIEERCSDIIKKFDYSIPPR